MKSGKAVVLTVLALAGALAAIEWQPLYPPMRTCASMILDTLNHRAILFGGDSRRSVGEIYNDVWQMNLDEPVRHWARLNPSGTPPCPRYEHNAVYDPVGQRMLVFTGCDGVGIVNDVWALSLVSGSEAWTQLNSANPPPERYVSYVVFHPGRNSMIVFGGTSTSQRFDETWELKLDSLVWRQLSPSGTIPSPRTGGGAFYDALNNRMVVFAGHDYTQAFSETWALSLTPGAEAWEELEPTGAVPDARYGFASGWDQTSKRFYVFAGWSYYSGLWYNDTRVLDMAAMTWTELTPSGQLPFECRNPSGVFDPRHGDFVFFGGDQGGDWGLNETWFLHTDAGGMAEWHGQPSGGLTPSIAVTRTAGSSLRVRCHLAHPGPIKVSILDATGRLVTQLYTGTASTPDAELIWNCRDASGHRASAGEYYCLLETDGRKLTGTKFVLSR
jgi:hypothetical protein